MDPFAVQILPCALWGAIMALLARRKNLNMWLWAALAFVGSILLGVVFLLVELTILAFMPYKCSKCKAPLKGKGEISKKLCPACDLVQVFGEDGPPAPDRT